MTDREYPESETCAKCGEHTAFEWDELEGWTSVCCTWTAMRLDQEAPEVIS
jgi:uncharacterized OB-fold protein